MNKENDNSRLDEHKSLAFYNATYQAIIQFSLEEKKQLLVISSLALGYLLTLKQELNEIHALIIWAVSALSFLTTIIICTITLKTGSKYFFEIVKSNDDGISEMNDKLKKHVAVISWSFSLGMIFAVIHFLYTAIHKLQIN